jgi:hypothetical protein
MNHFVDKVIEAMLGQIQKYGLELMQRYPDDLLVHDRYSLEKHAVPGAKIAWMVGHSHTHLVVLGLHAAGNEGVTFLTNLANDDRFYVMSVSGGEQFSLKEVEREEFTRLANTPVPYKREGSASDFWLYRGKERIGHVAVESAGTMMKPHVNAVITPVHGISKLDTSALDMWCNKATVEVSHSLFVRSTTTWAEPLRLAA